MKQKIVIKVQMHCGKCRKQAMKIAATADGVISVAIQGNDKDQIVVVGNEVDSAGLCTAMRKKLGNAILISVEEVKDPKPEEKKKDEKSEEKKPEKAPEVKKKDEGGQQEKKKEQETKKPESTPAPTAPMYYHYPYQPPPNYYCPNPQYYMYTVPPDDNQGCVIM